MNVEDIDFNQLQFVVDEYEHLQPLCKLLKDANVAMCDWMYRCADGRGGAAASHEHFIRMKSANKFIRKHERLGWYSPSSSLTTIHTGDIFK